MANTYFAILTNYGSQAIAQAIAAKSPLKITEMAVGDGNGQQVTPTA